MANVGIFIPALILSIFASVTAFGFLITQLIFMCFGRSKKKKQKHKTEKKIGGKIRGRSSGVVLRNVEYGHAKREDGGKCEVIDASKIAGVSIRVDGGCATQENRGVPNGETSDADGGDINANEKVGDDDGGGYDDGTDGGDVDGDINRDNDKSKIDSENIGDVNHAANEGDDDGGNNDASGEDGSCGGDKRIDAGGLKGEPNITANADTIHCTFKSNNKETSNEESGDVDTDISNETNHSATGKSLPSSCNNQCACQCNQVDIYGKDGHERLCKDHDIVYVEKHRIKLKLDVDITKYQIESCRLDEQFNDGEEMEMNSLEQTSNRLTSFIENAFCDNVLTGEITSKCNNRSCSCSNPANNDGLFLGNNCHENELLSCENISVGEPMTKDIAIQVCEEDRTSQSSRHSGQNSPTVSTGSDASTGNSPTVSCCCSHEYHDSGETDSASSSEIMNFYEYNINTKTSTEFGPSNSSRSGKYAIEHRINMDCIEIGYEPPENTLRRRDAQNSSIVQRLLSRIAECCISALNRER